MNQIIKDWGEFCEKGTVFNDGYFYTLFMEGVTLDEVKEIYKSFPNSAKLTFKMKKFLFEAKPIIANYENKIIELERLIKLDFEERESILQKIDVFSIFNANHNF